MKVFPKNVIYHGFDHAPPERTPLRAGPVSLFYQRLANLSDEKQAVRLTGISGALRSRMLDEATADLAMRDPEGFRERSRKASANLELRPFAYCRVDIDESKS